MTIYEKIAILMLLAAIAGDSALLFIIGALVLLAINPWKKKKR